MKKTLIAMALAFSLVGSTYGQGFVLFSAGSSAATRISTNSVVGGAATGLTFANAGTTATTYYYALFYSVAATTVSGSTAAVAGIGNYAFNDGNWTFANASSSGAYIGADYGTNTLAGRLTSTVADASNSGGTLVNSGAAQQFVVVGWSASIGSTVASLISWYNNGSPSTIGWVGESAVSGAITPGAGGLSSPPPLFGASPQISGFTLGVVPVPEPGTIALATLGGLSMLALRRRKA